MKYRTTSAVAANVIVGTITDCPAFNPVASNARCSAAVQEFTATACFCDTYRANSASNCLVFGPVVSLMEFSTFEEAVEIANSIDYGLSTSIYTKDVNRAFTAMRDLEAGITYINAPTIGAEVHLPFGGVKHTGNGHREGLGALDFFTTWKAVYVDYSDKLQMAQIDNAE